RPYRRFHIRHSWRWKQVAYFVHAVFLTILILLIGADLAYVNIRLPNDTLAPTTASWGEYARSRGFPLLVVAIGVSWVRFLLGLKKWSFAKPPAPTLVGCCIGADTTPIEIDKYTFHLVQEVAGIDRRTAAAAKAMVHSASDDDDDDDDKKDENGNPLGVEDIMITGIKFPKWYIADLGVLAVTMFMGHLSLAMMPIGIITNEAIFLVLHHTVIVYLVTTCYMHMIMLCTVNVLTFLFSHFVIYVVALGGHVGSTRLLLVVLYLVGGMLMAWARELKQVYHFELLALHRAVLQATKEELVLQRHLFSVLLPACMRDGKSVTQIAAHRRTMAEHAHGISGVPLLPPVRIHYSDLCTIAIRLDPRVFAGIMTSPATFVAKMDSILNAIECVVYQANALILARRRYAHSNPNNIDGMTSSSSSDDDDNDGSEKKGSGGGKKWLAGGGSSVTREELISRIHVKGDIILFAGPMVRESAPSNNNKPKRRHEEGEDDDNDAEDELPPVVNTAAERLVGRALEVMLLISKTFMEADQFSSSQESHQQPKPALLLTASGTNKGQVSTTLGESGGGGDVSSFTSSGGVSAGLYASSQKQSGEPRMLFPVSLMNSTDPQRSNSPSSGGRGGGGVGTLLVSPTSSTTPHQPHLRLTSVVCLGSGFVTMLGSRGLTPSLMGSVARQTSALILAAPTGFHGCSSHFLNSLSVYGVAAPKAVISGNVSEKSATVSSISDIVDYSNVRDASNSDNGNTTATPYATATGVVSLPLQKWRIRGSGVMLVHPLGLTEKNK
ncbi:membrane-associated protein, putative, partial [Bodo saltans]